MPRLHRTAVISLAALLCLFVADPTIGARIEEEARVKTAYIYNFCKYVTWPPGGLQDAVDICLLGSDPLAEHLPALTSKTVQGRALAVNLHSTCLETGCCEVVFISATEQGRLADILKKLNGRPVLTISDMERFAERGGMIQLVRRGSKIRFIINRESLDEAGLSISSRLLKLAVRVLGGSKG